MQTADIEVYAVYISAYTSGPACLSCYQSYTCFLLTLCRQNLLFSVVTGIFHSFSSFVNYLAISIFSSILGDREIVDIWEFLELSL